MTRNTVFQCVKNIFLLSRKKLIFFTILNLLITSLHVLTAAECVLKDEASVMTPNPVYNTPENVYVQLGQSWISGPKFRSISKITTHPLAFAANVFKDPANARILKGNLYNFGD